MTQTDTVLAVIEWDNFPEVVATKAAWIARLYGCEVHLMLSDPSSRLSRDSVFLSHEATAIAAGIEEAQRQLLADLDELVSVDNDSVVSTSVVHERPAHQAIIERTLEISPRFVVKGTQYHSAAERGSFTFTDWQLMRKLTVPLLLVKANPWKENPLIVAAVDPMHKHDKDGTLDQLIVDAGTSLTSKSGGRLMILHTYQRLIEIGNYAKYKFKPEKLPIDELDLRIRDDHRQRLNALASANSIDIKEAHQLPGRTHEILPAFVRSHGADLVIMGAVARSGLKQRALGSTAERVLDHLPCDVLIVRAKAD